MLNLLRRLLDLMLSASGMSENFYPIPHYDLIVGSLTFLVVTRPNISHNVHMSANSWKIQDIHVELSFIISFLIFEDPWVMAFLAFPHPTPTVSSIMLM